MIFIKTFKGYEDKVQDLDKTVNEWIAVNNVIVRDVKTGLSHEHQSLAGSGDLVYTILYEADEPHDGGAF